MAEKDYSLDRRLVVEGAENTGLSFHLAGLGSRMLAYFLDSLIQGAVVFFLLIFFGAAGLFIPAFQDGWEMAGLAVGLLVSFVVIWGYYIVFELAWNGQTPGKKALGIKVVLDNGRPVTFIASFLRNTLRVADMLPVSYAAGIVAIFVSPKEKRLGDMAAGTLVVKEPRAERPQAFSSLLPPEASAAPLTEEEIRLRQRTRHLTVGDHELLRDFLKRRNSLDPAVRYDLAVKLAGALAARLNEAPPADPERFLETLAAALS